MNRSKEVILPLLQWYGSNRRDLPWRRTMQPYRILVSEVMLQQTQVDRVIVKYRSFLSQFPSVKRLAEASPADVITAWEGLGYNRRALYLQKAAVMIRSIFSGRFPKEEEALKMLPGVGDYTSRAILSFAFDRPVALLDTNHRKFYARIFGYEMGGSDRKLLEQTKEVVGEILEIPSIFSDGRSMVYHWNQALMDFGATFLVRGADFNTCPIKNFDKKFPEVVLSLRKKKKSVPFRETDRYYRGRIVDLLRKKRQIYLADVRVICADIPLLRQKKIIEGLLGDGLIKKDGYSIILP